MLKNKTNSVLKLICNGKELHCCSPVPTLVPPPLPLLVAAVSHSPHPHKICVFLDAVEVISVHDDNICWVLQYSVCILVFSTEFLSEKKIWKKKNLILPFWIKVSRQFVLLVFELEFTITEHWCSTTTIRCCSSGTEEVLIQRWLPNQHQDETILPSLSSGQMLQCWHAAWSYFG